MEPVKASLGLLAEEFLGLWVVDQDLRQVLLVQDEQVSETMSLHVGRASVASAPCKQADQSQHVVRRVCSIDYVSVFAGT